MKQALMILALVTVPLLGPAMADPVTPAKFSITNADGSPVSCEDVLKAVRDAAAVKAPAQADQAKFDDLQGKGLERCNADDDKRADDFFAAAMALVGR